MHIIIETESKIGILDNTPNWCDDWHLRYFPKSKSCLDVEAYYISETIPDTNIMYNEELSGPDGMDFMLFVPWGTDESIVTKAKKYLRSNRDVTHIYVKRLHMFKFTDKNWEKTN